MDRDKINLEEIQRRIKSIRLMRSSCLFIRYILSIEASNKTIKDFLEVFPKDDGDTILQPSVSTFRKDKHQQSVLAGVTNYDINKQKKDGELSFAVMIGIGKPPFPKDVLNTKQDPFELLSELFNRFKNASLEFQCHFVYPISSYRTRVNLPAKLETTLIDGAELTGFKIDIPHKFHHEERSIELIISVLKDKSIVTHRINSTVKVDLIPELFLDLFNDATKLSEKFIIRREQS